MAITSLPQEPQRQGREGEDHEATAGARAGVFVEVAHAVFHRLVDLFLDIVRHVVRDFVIFGVSVEVIAHEAIVYPGAGEAQVADWTRLS
jgi:hypothetical protein